MNNTLSTYTNWQLVRRLLALVWNYRRGCVHILALQVTLLSFGLLGLNLTGVGVDYLRQVLAGGVDARFIEPRWPLGIAPPAAWDPMAVIALLAGAILILASLRSGLNMYYTIVMNKLLQGRIVVDWRSRVYEKMQQLSFTFFDAHAGGSIINRVTSDVQGVRSFIDGVVLQTVIILLSLAVYVIYMARIHPGLTLASLSTTPLLWMVTNRFARRVRPAYARNRELFDNLVRTVSENVQGMHVVKGFARMTEQMAAFERINAEIRSQKWWIFRQIALFQPLTGMLTQLNIVVLLAYGGYLVIQRESAGSAAGVSIGDLIVFAGLLQQFSGQVANIASIADCMQQSLTSAQRVFEILDAPVTVQSPVRPFTPARVHGDVCFERVTFGYTCAAPILREVSLHVPQGARVALLGATGAGKTTLLSLIPRFYDVQDGQVRIDGRDVRDFDLNVLRRGIGIVFQDNFLFSNSIRANIAFGHPEATDKQIEQAARLALADEFIRALPDGYETILHENGMNLSGGQRQRIAIARALLPDPPILLLDDPTAAVDPETEAGIMESIEQAMAGRTVLIVAHRLSTLRRADKIVVLENGAVTQEGSHAGLADVGGLYKEVVALQTAAAGGPT